VACVSLEGFHCCLWLCCCSRCDLVCELLALMSVAQEVCGTRMSEACQPYCYFGNTGQLAHFKWHFKWRPRLMWYHQYH
jgi:hypothetical protein